MKITKTEIIIGVVIVIVLGVGIFYAASRKKALVGSLVFGGSGAQSGAVASPVSRKLRTILVILSKIYKH